MRGRIWYNTKESALRACLVWEVNAVFFFSRRSLMTDGVIDLREIFLCPPDAAMGFGLVRDWVIQPHGIRREAGRISLRLGESECIYYFGHIGYHVEPRYRGDHFAARACMLIRPEAELEGKRSLVITADPANLPSRKVCERLGCVLENTVNVPERIRTRWDISAVKCRYIWRICGDTPMPSAQGNEAR